MTSSTPSTDRCADLGWEFLEGAIPADLWRRLAHARQRVNRAVEAFARGELTEEDLVLIREALEALAERAVEYVLSGGAGWIGRSQ